MKKPKTLDAYVKLMNRYCKQVFEGGNCKHDCIGIGWCEAVFDMRNAETDEEKKAGE